MQTDSDKHEILLLLLLLSPTSRHKRKEKNYTRFPPLCPVEPRPHLFKKQLPHHLQALRVIVVDLVAGGSRNARAATGPSNSTTLAVLGERAARWVRRWVSGWVGGVGGWLAPVCTVGRAEITKADVREHNLGVRGVGLNISWYTGGGCARAARDTRERWVLVDGEIAVKPEHVDIMIVPDAENDGDAAGKCLSHSGKTTLALEAVGVAEDGFLLGTEVGGDRVAGGDAGDIDLGVLDDNVVLDIQTTDLGKWAGGGAVSSNELGDDGELGVGVDSLAGSVELLLAETVGVEVTAVFVAETAVPVVTITALGAGAACLPDRAARMGSVGSRDGVGLPEVHLGAAGSIAALAGVNVVGGTTPV